MSSSAEILCTKCGGASASALSQCAKCGGKNARVCGGCGFQNSLPKNYCDRCGNPISDLAHSVAPSPVSPSKPKAAIPATVVKHLKKDPVTPAALPAAKLKAAEPGAPQGSPPFPTAGRQSSDTFSAPAISGDLWAPTLPPHSDDLPKAPRWLGPLRRILTAAFATLAVISALIATWHFSENNKPENAVQQAAVRYLQALHARDYAAAYSQFSLSARKYCTLEEFVATRDTSTWTWSNLRIEYSEPGAMLLAYELNIQSSGPRTDRVLFVEEDRKWVRPYTWSLMQKVEEAFDKDNADMGLVLAQAAATVNPRDPMARGYLCEAAYYRKSANDTERQCVAAIELSRIYHSNLSLKSLYHLHAILADTYKNALHKPELALEQFAQMLSFPSISPADQCEILLARTEAYMTLSRPGEALTDANRADQLCTRPQDHLYIDDIRRKLNAPAQ